MDSLIFFCIVFLFRGIRNLEADASSCKYLGLLSWMNAALQIEDVRFVRATLANPKICHQ